MLAGSPTSEWLASLVADALPAAGEVRLSVTGRSMLPSLWPGDVLTVRPQGAESIERGDIVLFQRRGRLFTHRVVRQMSDGAGLIAHGDGLLRPDAPVRASDVLGRVVLVTRAGRSWKPARRRSPLGRLVSFSLRRIRWAPGLLVRLDALLRRWKVPAPQTKHHPKKPIDHVTCASGAE